MSELTPAQIENWRRVLSQTIGIAAYMLPAEEIQKRRDEMQEYADELGEEDE